MCYIINNILTWWGKVINISYYNLGRSADEICLIVDRILKCNHPSLDGENKVRLCSFMVFDLFKKGR